MVKAIEQLKDTPYPLSLSPHYKTKEDKKSIREAFKDYWHLFTIILWNNRSRRGSRSDVRLHSLEGMRIILRTWAIFIDSDLNTKTYFYGDHDGERSVHQLTATMWLDKLFERMHQFRDTIFFGVKNDHNWINWEKHEYGKQESFFASNLSGVWPIWLDNLQDYDPMYNPWSTASAAGLHYFEDIAASYELYKRRIYIRFNDLSWDGDRGGYYNNSFQRFRDAGVVLLITGKGWVYGSQKKDWSKDGRFSNLKTALKDEAVDLNDTLNLAKTVDELIAKKVKENRKVLEFKGGLHADADI